ncbi:nucleoside hydrolase [Enterococcus dongliensis]|uniref:nucleoside hydrolase n=1 Tax=Enterococcus dongliensis TaxID=2559925 RepID=UPI0028900564|nr:nucleoside hydrolase [Enterococcus dongliensis]MDT2612108.1 nucleoside hydrolase [Enterococcus dongliensis]MDT2640405.1 nucleoside hydrolase [Enterococcus dongliensis]
MRKVILDCDNTFGLIDHDVDDGLTLFYLLGTPTIELLGLTLTHGNSKIEEVEQMIQLMHMRLNLAFDYYARQQAEFLVEKVNQYPNEVTILATGALTNLLEAQKLDPDFFEKVQEIVLMGGTLEPLTVNQRSVTELNFSSDPAAAKAVLLSRAPLTIMNGHMTSAAFFSSVELDQFLDAAKATVDMRSLDWIKNTLKNWISWNEKVFGFDGFCNWDMTTAVYLDHPEFFSQEQYYLSDEQPELSKGRMIVVEQSKNLVKMPKQLISIAEFNQLIIRQMVLGLSKQQ